MVFTAGCVFERVIHSKALTLLLVFGHEPPREAAAVMLFSRVVAPEMFPAVLGACFAEASKLRLQQVMQPSQTLVIFRFIFLQRLGPSVSFDSQGPGGPYVAPHLIRCKKIIVTFDAVIGSICTSSVTERSCFSYQKF